MRADRKNQLHVCRQMEEYEELSDFDKGQVVVALELGVSVSKTAKMVGCTRAAVVNTYRQWHEEGLRLRAGRPRLLDPRELADESESEEEEEVSGEEGGAAGSEDVKSNE